MSDIQALIFAILAGIFTTIESSINANLGQLVSPKIATLHSLITGTLIIFVLNLLSGSVNDYMKVFKVPITWLLGGFFGAFIIYFATRSMPKLGISTTLTLIVVSQIISGLFIETVILKTVTLDFYKISGIVMILYGIYLVISKP